MFLSPFPSLWIDVENRVDRSIAGEIDVDVPECICRRASALDRVGHIGNAEHRGGLGVLRRPAAYNDVHPERVSAATVTEDLPPRRLDLPIAPVLTARQRSSQDYGDVDGVRRAGQSPGKSYTVAATHQVARKIDQLPGLVPRTRPGVLDAPDLGERCAPGLMMVPSGMVSLTKVASAVQSALPPVGAVGGALVDNPVADAKGVAVRVAGGGVGVTAAAVSVSWA